MTTAEQAVAKGATLLDEKRPDWFEHVDIDLLETRNMFKCVLGQVFGFYTNGRLELFPGNIGYIRREELCAEHGFDEPSGVLYSELDNAWANEIIERRNAA